MRIAIAGANGFVGRHLIDALLSQTNHQIVALTRSSGARSLDARLTWQTCDLFSILQLEEALKGVDVAYYLVHSMSPNERLAQGTFEDFDLMLADNFARACRACGVRQIIYLGGIIPRSTKLSAHLASRLEVEEALSAHAVPLTTLRAGLIIGPKGSSYQILERLVRRLPVMLCPSWTQTLSSPVDISDVVRSLIWVLGRQAEVMNRFFDLAGAEVLSYQQLMRQVALRMGLRRLFIPVPFFSPTISKLWVRLFSGVPSDLVYPLVESLKYEMLPDPRKRLAGIAEPIRLQESLDRAASDTARSAQRRSAQAETVRSVQRMRAPRGATAQSIADEYMNWLGRVFAYVIVVKRQGDTCRFSLFGRLDLLVLERSRSRSAQDRELLYLTGGVLVRNLQRKPRLEFRLVLGGRYVLAAIHDFVPALPWFIYRNTQAVLHLLVMRAFGRYLNLSATQNKAG